MKRAVTLKENYEFRRMYQRGASAAGKTMVVYCRKNKLGHNRLGLTASTKLGHAVVRNRCRRRLREVFRLNGPQLRQNKDEILYNFIENDNKTTELVYITAKSVVDTTGDSCNNVTNLLRKHFEHLIWLEW